MPEPLVSFVIPCYNLAHLLEQCVFSILAQTFTDYEVLIMDDCSPDNTAEVVKSFQDSRIRHVRNEHNLGHLRNYNKGICFSRGKYVWLISADDCLRRPYVLKRYVELMERNPSVGYTFCPAVGVRYGCETAVLQYSQYSDRDRVVNGRHFLRDLLHHNIVVAASALARRECYQKLSLFPLNVVWAGAPVEMGWVGDWYLWCLFALSYDVGYFAEPMVRYREHELSMTNTLTRKETVANCSAADIAMFWLVRQRATELGLRETSKQCLAAVAQEYARQFMCKPYAQAASAMSLAEIEESLRRSTPSECERQLVRARLWASIGDKMCFKGDWRSARQYYFKSLRRDLRLVSVYVK